MKSAYAVLGIPGNATQAEIDQAFQKATEHYSHARLADDPEAISRLAEVRDAHKLLSSADVRAAHDRKLSASLHARVERTRVIVEADPPAWYSKPMIIMALLVFGMFAMGGYMSHSRNQVRKAEAAQELAKKKIEAEAAALAEAQQASAEAERVRVQARADSQERQLRMESSTIARNVAYSNQQQESLALRQIETERRDKQRREYEVKNEEQRRVSEAQRKLAADKQRIRELCYQQYRQTNC